MKSVTAAEFKNLSNEELMQRVFDVRTHNGFITCDRKKTGNHRTFRISHENWGTKEKPQIRRVVAMLTGPDRNDSKCWQKFGFAYEDSGVKLWNRFKNDKKFQVYADLLNRADAWSHQIDYMFEGRCRCCTSTLTNPVSITLGIGPVCGGHGNRRSALKNALVQMQAA